MHRLAAIAAHTTAIVDAADAYRRENHCPCGEFLAFSPDDRYPRLCDYCKMRASTRAAIWSEVAS